MKNVFRIKYIVEGIIAAVCVAVCAIALYKYGINAPVQVWDRIVIAELVGFVAIILAYIDQYIYEHCCDEEE